MSRHGTLKLLAVLLAIPMAFGCHTVPPSNSANPARVRVVASQPLPSAAAAYSGVSIVEVTYAPGGSSTPHSHPCPVIGYVVQGAFRSQVSGQPEVVLKAGEGFYENPNVTHLISANASNKDPVKFIAVFICEQGQEPK